MVRMMYGTCICWKESVFVPISISRRSKYVVPINLNVGDKIIKPYVLKLGTCWAFFPFSDTSFFAERRHFDKGSSSCGCRLRGKNNNLRIFNVSSILCFLDDSLDDSLLTLATLCMPATYLH